MPEIRSTKLNILLDLDGTLTDPCEGFCASVEHAMRVLGRPCPPPDELATHIGPPLQLTFARLLGPGSDAAVDKAVSLYRERYADKGLYENRLYPGIPEVLRLLNNEGAGIFLATSKPGIYATRILENFGLSAFFRGVYGSELDGALSDKSELIAHLLRSESLSADQSVMVGDRKHDIIGAKTNGVFPVGVLWGYGSSEELSAAGARMILSRQEELGLLTTALRRC